MARSAIAFDEAAPSCCALAEKDSRPSPPLPSLPGGVSDLFPDEGLDSVILISAQQRTAHSFDRSLACGVGWYVWRPCGGVGGEEQVA